MSRKPRPKKKYQPRRIAVPSYVANLDPSIGEIQEKGRSEDRLFLLRIANRTAGNDDLVLHCQLLRAAWLLAEKMKDTETIKHCLFEGIEAIGAYLSKDPTDFTDQYFEKLSQAMEVCRSIFENSGKLERMHTMEAVLENRFTLAMMEKEKKANRDKIT